MLNFGPSEYATYSSRTEPDMLVDIHESGQLPEISSNLEKISETDSPATISTLSPREMKRTFPSVEFPLRKNEEQYLYNYDYEYKVILLWLEERKEWVGLVYRKWLESFPKKDEHYEGPFSLDKYCQGKICEAYRITPTGRDLEGICRIAPDELAKIAGGRNDI